MTVTSEKNRMEAYATDGVVVDFDFDLEIYEASEIQVWYEPDSENYYQLTLNTDYGVTFGDGAGTVTTDGYRAALPTGKLLLIRHLNILQETDWFNNDSHSEVQHQTNFDRGCMIDLQMQEQIDRVVMLAIHSGTTGIILPEPEANYLLGWNSGGTNMANISVNAIAVLVADLLGDVLATIPAVLTDLTDVTITAPAAGHMVRYSGTAWENYACPASRIIGRKATGNVDALTAAQARTVLGLDTDDAVTFGSLTIGAIAASGTLTVNTINEKTGAAGVTIEGVELKDNAVTASGIGTFAGFNLGSSDDTFRIVSTELHIKGNVKIFFDSPLLEFDISDNSVTYDGTTFAITNNATISGALGVTGAITGGSLAIDSPTLVVNASSYEDRVGIGTATPDELLHVSGGNILLDNTQQIRMKDAGGTENNVLVLTSATHTDELILGAGSGIDNLSLATGGTRRLFINNLGNVGIGTSSPDRTLEIMQSGATSGLKISTDATYALFNLTPRGSSGNSNKKAIFQMYDLNAENVRIDTEGDSWFNGGNVGIGVADPQDKLEVNGTVLVSAVGKFQSNVVADAYLTLLLGADNNANTLTDNTRKSCQLGMPHYDIDEQAIALFYGDASAATNYLNFGGGAGAMNAATHIRFFTAANTTTTTGTERMRIESDGNVVLAGNITLDSDSNKLLLGDDQDFEIFFDGVNKIVGTTANLNISFSASAVGAAGYGLNMTAGAVTTDTDGGTGAQGGSWMAAGGVGGAVSGGAGANIGGLGGNLSFAAGAGGAASTGGTNAGGDGGAAELGGGRGGAGDAGSGGDGGLAKIIGGAGSSNYGGVGGVAVVVGGAGGTRQPAGYTGGDGGDATITGGAGGAAAIGTQGDGGNVVINGGAGDTIGHIFLGATRGYVRIGSAVDPTVALDVTGVIKSTGAITATAAGSTFGGNPVPKKLYVSCEPQLGTGDWGVQGVTLTDDEYCRFNFHIGDYIDASQDIKITFILESNEADATEDMELFVGALKTDNNEASAWNIEDETAFTFDSENANRLSKYQYTLVAAGYEADDVIVMAIQNKTGTATIIVYSCVFEMVAKDS